jgi:HSP20 family protein
MAKAEKSKENERPVTPRRQASEMGRMERERDMSRLFEDFFGPRWSPFRRGFWPTRRETLPSVDIDLYEEKDAVVVKAELPGIDKDGIEVNVSDHVLTVRGEKKKEEETKDEDYYFSECSYGAFARSIELPAEVQTDQAKAVFKNGVLEIRLPKIEGAKPRGIPVKVD